MLILFGVQGLDKERTGCRGFRLFCSVLQGLVMEISKPILLI